MIIKFIVNRVQVELLGRLPEIITSLIVEVSSVYFEISDNQALLLKRWLNQVVERITSKYIEYQGALVRFERRKDEISCLRFKIAALELENRRFSQQLIRAYYN